MNFINTDGMSFIGPGSEWFWTALGVIIAAVTLFGIYRQLRLQLGAGAIVQMETINKEFQSEQMSRARLAVLLALRDFRLQLLLKLVKLELDLLGHRPQDVYGFVTAP